VLIVGLLFAREYSGRQWLLVLAVSTIATGLGFLLLEPGLARYVGFSGVLHAAWRGPRGVAARPRDTLTWTVTALFAAKLGWEHLVGPLPFTSSSLSCR